MLTIRRLLLVVFALIALALIATPWSRSIEERTSLMWLFQLRGHIASPENVRVIAIHTDAARTLGLSNQPAQWSRKVYADLITHLNNLGAKLIVFDIAFKTGTEEDALLSQSLREAGNVLLFQYVERETRDIPGLGNIDVQQPIRIPRQLEQAALATANFTLPWGNGPVVATKLYRDFGQGLKASLPIVALQQLAASQKPSDTRLKETENAEIFPKKNIKKYFANSFNSFNNAPFYINFYGPPKTLTTIGIDELWRDTTLSLKDAVVFVGLSETIQTAQRDVHKTVFSQSSGLDVSGVEILATVFANLQNNQNIRPSPLYVDIALVLLLLGLVYASQFFFIPRYTLGIQIFMVVILVLVAAMLFEHHYIWLPFFLPCILMFCLYLILMALRYHDNVRANKASMLALARYVPKRVALQLAQKENTTFNRKSVVEGVCLMTDLQGYSTLSEQIAPEELHALLNTYYSILEKTVSRFGGEVANIVGDSMLALWLDNTLNPSHCVAAVNAAQSLLAAETETKAQALLLITSIGIHSGNFSMGHLGAGQHFEYAPVGDTVNTVARIEKLNRKLKTRLLISKPVMLGLEQAGKKYSKGYIKPHFNCVGTFTLHNKHQSVVLYTPSS